MKHSLLGGLLALWLPCLSFASDAPAHQKPADEIIERASIRARGRSHGEVRLVRRGPALVLQTLLVTRNLARVATQIRDNEAANWPEGSWGHAESRRYRDALDRDRNSANTARYRTGCETGPSLASVSRSARSRRRTRRHANQVERSYGSEHSLEVADSRPRSLLPDHLGRQALHYQLRV